MLELDPLTIILEILNFLALTVLLYFLVFKRVIKSIAERTAKKEALMIAIQNDRDEAERIKLEINERLAQIDGEAIEIVKQAQNQIDFERKKLLDAAHLEAEKLLRQAYQEKKQYEKQSLDEFHEEMMDTIIKISTQIISKNAPASLQSEMVDQLVHRVWDFGKHEMEQVQILRHALGDRTPTMLIETANPLTPEQQRALVQSFSALADHTVKAEIKLNPKLGVGIKVRMGDIVLDNSIAAQILDLKEDIIEQLKDVSEHG
jgi:F-type H+-transporting ATPase subunit b